MPGKLRSASKLGSDGAEDSMETLPKPSEKVSPGAPGWVGPGPERVAGPLTCRAGWPYWEVLIASPRGQEPETAKSGTCGHGRHPQAHTDTVPPLIKRKKNKNKTQDRKRGWLSDHPIRQKDLCEPC